LAGVCSVVLVLLVLVVGVERAGGWVRSGTLLGPEGTGAGLVVGGSGLLRVAAAANRFRVVHRWVCGVGAGAGLRWRVPVVA
jgi:hypothetical protein